MNADLERLIALQRLDSAAEAARRRLAEEPERERALETRLESARQRVAHAKEHLTANQTARREIDKEVAVHQGRLSKYREQAIAAERAGIVGAMDRQTLAIFELVSSRRNGVALAEARDGICTICHVRLRPQVFNNVRRNEEIIQCDSCNRILYFVHLPAPAVQNP